MVEGRTSGLMAGKRGLVMGVANDHSIAWGIAEALAAAGAELAFSYPNDSILKRVEPLAATLGTPILFPCNVAEEAEVEALFQKLGAVWETIDFVVHAIAYSDKSGLSGEYLSTTRENFLMTLDISCFSFTSVCKYARPLLKKGGSILTLTYLGAERVMPNYNVMGVAKAALEASVRYIAADLGPEKIRVNAISAGPIKTLAASGIRDFRAMLKGNADASPLRENVTPRQVGDSALYLLSDLSTAVTGETLFVDSGYHIMGVGAVPATEC